MKTADDYDDLLQEISIVMHFIEDTVDCINKYIELKEVFLNDLYTINTSAPSFFGQVINSFEYKIIVSALRFFDDKRESSGINRILNRFEQSTLYNHLVKYEIETGRKMIKEYLPKINTLRPSRDKIYAHLDKKVILSPNPLSEEIIDIYELKNVLIKVWELLNKIMIKCGAMPSEFPMGINDLNRLISKIKNEK